MEDVHKIWLFSLMVITVLKSIDVVSEFTFVDSSFGEKWNIKMSSLWVLKHSLNKFQKSYPDLSPVSWIFQAFLLLIIIIVIHCIFLTYLSELCVIEYQCDSRISRFLITYLSSDTHSDLLKVGELASERLRVVALLFELILCDIMKLVPYGGEPPHFIFTLMLTLTYAFGLK